MNSSRSHRLGALAIALCSVMVVMLAGGCQLFQGKIAPERRPTVVGIIAEREVTQTND